MQPQDPCEDKSLPNPSPCIPGLLLCLGDTVLNELPTLMHTELAPGIPPLPISHTTTKICSHCLPHSSQDLGKCFQYYTHTQRLVLPQSTSRFSRVHNSQLVRKTGVNYLSIPVARATALLFCLFVPTVPGKTPRQCSAWWSSQYNDQTYKINSGCVRALLKLLQPNRREFVTSAALHLSTRDWRELFENGREV